MSETLNHIFTSLKQKLVNVTLVNVKSDIQLSLKIWIFEKNLEQLELSIILDAVRTGNQARVQINLAYIQVTAVLQNSTEWNQLSFQPR